MFSGVLLRFLSPWIAFEAEHGRNRNALLPVRIEPVDPPVAFRRKQAADLIEWEDGKDHEGLQLLLTDIREYLATEERQQDADRADDDISHRARRVEPEITTLQQALDTARVEVRGLEVRNAKAEVQLEESVTALAALQAQQEGSKRWLRIMKSALVVAVVGLVALWWYTTSLAPGLRQDLRATSTALKKAQEANGRLRDNVTKLTAEVKRLEVALQTAERSVAVSGRDVARIQRALKNAQQEATAQLAQLEQKRTALQKELTKQQRETTKQLQAAHAAQARRRPCP